MKTITYTGKKKGEPRITIPLFDGWYEMVSPQVDFAIIKNNGENKFSPNISLTVLEDSNQSNLQVTTQGVRNYLATLDSPAIITDKIGEVNGRDWHIVEFATENNIVGGIIQIIATVVEKKEDVTYVYRFTGTALQVDIHTDFMEIRKIISEIKLKG